jgi:hypothetical protein
MTIDKEQLQSFTTHHFDLKRTIIPRVTLQLYRAVGFREIDESSGTKIFTWSIQHWLYMEKQLNALLSDQIE